MSSLEVDALMEKAQKYIKTAEHLLEYGDYESSASRSYYSMYYITKAESLVENAKSFFKEIEKYIKNRF